MVYRLKQKRLLKVFFISLLVSILLATNVSAAAFNVRWGYWGKDYNTDTYYRPYSFNQTQFTLDTNGFNYAYDPQLVFTFPTDSITIDNYYSLTIYIAGSVTTTIEDNFFTGTIRPVYHSNIVFNYTDKDLDSAEINNLKGSTVPYYGEEIIPWDSESIYNTTSTGNNYTYQVIFKGEDLLFDKNGDGSQTGYSGLMFDIGASRWQDGKYIVLNSFNVVGELADPSDTLKVVQAIGDQTKELIEAYETGNQELVDQVINESEALQQVIGQEGQAVRDLIEGETLDTQLNSDLDNSVGKLLNNENELVDLVTQTYTVTINDQEYSLNFNGDIFGDLTDAYAGLFDTTTLDTLGYVGIILEMLMSPFALLIYFCLLLGLIGALLGRHKT